MGRPKGWGGGGGEVWYGCLGKSHLVRLTYRGLGPATSPAGQKLSLYLTYTWIGILGNMPGCFSCLIRGYVEPRDKVASRTAYFERIRMKAGAPSPRYTISRYAQLLSCVVKKLEEQPADDVFSYVNRC